MYHNSMQDEQTNSEQSQKFKTIRYCHTVPVLRSQNYMLMRHVSVCL